MKITTGTALLVVLLCCGRQFALAASGADDPCREKKSNVEMRECYSSEQARVNAEADALANQIAGTLRKDGQDSENKSPVGTSSALRKAALELTHSQRTWRTYRDHHCKAVMYSWTSGSGAGTAYEACLFELGKTRVQELRSDFANTNK